MPGPRALRFVCLPFLIEVTEVVSPLTGFEEVCGLSFPSVGTLGYIGSRLRRSALNSVPASRR